MTDASQRRWRSASPVVTANPTDHLPFFISFLSLSSAASGDQGGRRSTAFANASVLDLVRRTVSTVLDRHQPAQDNGPKRPDRRLEKLRRRRTQTRHRRQQSYPDAADATRSVSSTKKDSIRRRPTVQKASSHTPRDGKETVDCFLYNELLSIAALGGRDPQVGGHPLIWSDNRLIRTRRDGDSTIGRVLSLGA